MPLVNDDQDGVNVTRTSLWDHFPPRLDFPTKLGTNPNLTLGGPQRPPRSSSLHSFVSPNVIVPTDPDTGRPIISRDQMALLADAHVHPDSPDLHGDHPEISIVLNSHTRPTSPATVTRRSSLSTRKPVPDYLPPISTPTLPFGGPDSAESILDEIFYTPTSAEGGLSPVISRSDSRTSARSAPLPTLMSRSRPKTMKYPTGGYAASEREAALREREAALAAREAALTRRESLLSHKESIMTPKFEFGAPRIHNRAMSSDRPLPPLPRFQERAHPQVTPRVNPEPVPEKEEKEGNAEAKAKRRVSATPSLQPSIASAKDKVIALTNLRLWNRSPTPAVVPGPGETEEPFDVDRTPSRHNLLEAATCFVKDENGDLICFGDFFPVSSETSGTPTTGGADATPGANETESQNSDGRVKHVKTIVFFIRHFWCGQCQDYTLASLALLDPVAIAKAGIRIVVISNGSWKIIKSYRRILSCPFPIYVDGPRKLYRLMGMTKMTNDFGPLFKGRAAYHQRPVPTQLLHGLKNGIFKFPLADPGMLLQLGGEFILSPGFSCDFAHRMTTTSDHLEAADVARKAGVEVPSKTEVTHQSITEDQEAELERMEEEMQLWRQNREKELERIRRRKAERRGELYQSKSRLSLDTSNFRLSDSRLALESGSRLDLDSGSQMPLNSTAKDDLVAGSADATLPRDVGTQDLLDDASPGVKGQSTIDEESKSATRLASQQAEGLTQDDDKGMESHGVNGHGPGGADASLEEIPKSQGDLAEEEDQGTP